jgi:hypothetical protein
MYESCWYDTNIPTLWTYLKNRLRNVVDKEADIDRALARFGEAASDRVLAGDMVKAQKAEAK